MAITSPSLESSRDDEPIHHFEDDPEPAAAEPTAAAKPKAKKPSWMKLG